MKQDICQYCGDIKKSATFQTAYNFVSHPVLLVIEVSFSEFVSRTKLNHEVLQSFETAVDLWEFEHAKLRGLKNFLNRTEHPKLVSYVLDKALHDGSELSYEITK